MEGILRDAPGTVVYIDDVFFTGRMQGNHLKILDLTLSHLEEEGLSLRKQKCVFMLSRVESLGHTISAEGLQPSVEKIWAIIDLPTPHNIPELRSFLGMINYYSKLLENLSSWLAPLYRLLQQKTPWHWGTEERTIFEAVKKQLASAPFLEHYDLYKPLTFLWCFLEWGWVVLSHVLEDGTD